MNRFIANVIIILISASISAEISSAKDISQELGMKCGLLSTADTNDYYKNSQYNYGMTSFKVSPDGKNYAFITKKSNTKWVVVHNGKEGKEYAGMELNSIVFSPDSKKFAYIAQLGEKKKVVVENDIESRSYDNVLTNRLHTINDILDRVQDKIFYLPNNELVYIGQENDGYFIVKGGMKGESYASIGEMAYSPDGKSFAYFGIKSQLDKKASLIKDGKKTMIGVSVLLGMKYSPDGKSFAYSYADFNTKNYNKLDIKLIRDGKILSITGKFKGYQFGPKGEFDYIYSKSSSPDDYILNHDGSESSTYEDMYLPSYSPDGKRFSYIGKKGKYLYLVNGGDEKNRIVFDGSILVSAISFNPSGKGTAFVLQKGRIGFDNYLVKDGKAIRGYNPQRFGDYDFITYFMYSPDGRSYAFKSLDKEDYTLIRDKQILGPYRYIGKIMYSPDSKLFVYEGGSGPSGKSNMFINQKDTGISAYDYGFAGDDFYYFTSNGNDLSHYLCSKSITSAITGNPGNQLSSKEKIQLVRIKISIIKEIGRLSEGDKGKEVLVYSKIKKILEKKIDESAGTKNEERYIYLRELIASEYNKKNR